MEYMAQWFRKFLGMGAQVYQSLREIQDVRFRLDPDVTEDKLYIVASDTESADTFAYFPPGNSVVALSCDAVPCAIPDFNHGGLVKLSIETYPIIPAFPSDTLIDLDADDFRSA